MELDARRNQPNQHHAERSLHLFRRRSLQHLPERHQCYRLMEQHQPDAHRQQRHRLHSMVSLRRRMESHERYVHTFDVEYYWGTYLVINWKRYIRTISRSCWRRWRGIQLGWRWRCRGCFKRNRISRIISNKYHCWQRRCRWGIWWGKPNKRYKFVFWEYNYG
jgi:hypothetical protein